MSYMTLIIVHKKRMMHLYNHYHEIQKVADLCLSHSVVPAPKNFIHLDGGYILLDLDSKLIVDRQTCITLSKKKGFSLMP